MTTNRIPLDPEQSRLYSRYFTEKKQLSNGRRVPEWTLEIQGQRLTLKRPKDKEHRRRPGARTEIFGFSKQARFRMLKYIAGIDWRSVGPSLFITLTYPDDVAHNDKDKRNREKYLMLRYIENHLAKRICGLWRVEWKERLTGERKGESLPHFHLILFGVKFLSADFLREAWKCAIGCNGLPRIDVQRAKDGLHATRYIAKYVGKVVDPAVNLVGVTYLNSGRHYGYHRKRHIPLHLEVKFPLFDPSIIHFIRVRAGAHLKYLDLDYFETFTLLGEHAVKIAGCVMKDLFDVQREFCYDDSIKGDTGQ